MNEERMKNPEDEVPEDELPVDVIFRKWKDGDIIALFPNIAHDTNGFYCSSYMHVGQHGGADYAGVLTQTKLASESEYKNLKKELENIGYVLNVKTRWKRRFPHGS
jgi:hypothetical protein